MAMALPESIELQEMSSVDPGGSVDPGSSAAASASGGFFGGPSSSSAAAAGASSSGGFGGSSSAAVNPGSVDAGSVDPGSVDAGLVEPGSVDACSVGSVGSVSLNLELWDKLPFINELNPNDCYVFSPKWTGNAVVIRDASVTYASTGKEVLKGLNVTVKKGTSLCIFGYIGTGKSTLIKALCGQCRLNSGTVSIVGSEPGVYMDRSYSKIVGVMPQSYSLYKECSAMEFIEYFGSLRGMPKQLVRERIIELARVFQLSNLEKNVRLFSGGQKRRISLMASLIHNPSLLLLDEPFAGFDDVLRVRIWEYMNRRLAAGVTILMVTAYIHEAKHANKMVILYNGRNALEGTYAHFKRTLGCDTITDGVGKYIVNSERAIQRGGEINEGFESQDDELSNQGWDNEAIELQSIQVENGSVEDYEASSQAGSNQQGPNPDAPLEGVPEANSNQLVLTSDASPEDIKNLQDGNSKLGIPSSLRRIKAMAILNMTRIYRSWLFLTFTLLVPGLEVASMYVCYGQPPVITPIGVLNGELVTKNLSECLHQREHECTMGMLSCKILQYLPNNSFELIQYDEEDLMMADAKTGDIKAYFKFDKDFSKTLQLWVMLSGGINQKSRAKLEINVGLDAMDQAFSSYLQRGVYRSVEKFVATHMQACGLDYRLYLPPFLERFPVIGTNATTYADHSATGTLILVLFVFPMITTAIIMIENYSDGTLQRTVSTGVKLPEYYFSQFVTQGVFLFIQTVTVLFLLRLLYGRPFEGGWFQAMVVCMFVGFNGITAGFMMSTLCSSVMLSIYITIGLLIPNMAFSGVVWPTCAFGPVAQLLQSMSPVGYPIASFRAVMNKGWGLGTEQVWMGILSSVLYMIFFTFFHAILNRRNVY